MSRPDVVGTSHANAAIEAQAVWLHDLRNAINTAAVSSAVVRRFLESGQTDRALEFLSEVDQACDRCRILVSREPAGEE